MESVLHLYSQKQQQGMVRLCMDERSCQLLREVMMPLSPRAGVPRRIDNEYKREGTCVVLLAYDMDKGMRYTEVRERRTKKDYAEFMDKILTEHFGEVTQIKLAHDNLNTHTKGSFYEHLPLQKAGELSNLIDFVYSPSTVPGSTWQK